MISGWLFDLYLSKEDDNKMIFWIKLENSKNNRNNNYIRIEEKWYNFFYVASNKNTNLKQIIQNENVQSCINSFEFVTKFEKITDRKKSTVLKFLLNNDKKLKLANFIEKINGYQDFRIYNVDISPEQQYCFEHDIFPLGSYDIDKRNSILKWKSKIGDSVWNTDYIVPNFKIIHLKINFQKGKIVRLEDKLRSIIIRSYNNDKDNDYFKIENNSEEEILKQLMNIIDFLDPDFILTNDGDSITFPYLIHRAKINNINLYLGRDTKIPLAVESKRKEISYFSYGRIHFKPSTIRLHGRIHIDLSNSFIFRTGSNFDSLVEISRLCRMPLHAISRASIGKCLTSLHLYNATKRDLIVPWKPTLNEHPKTLMELYIADRGSLILEPEIGVHEKVAEFDFTSLYPSIMLKRNISAETVLCSCCFDNPKFRVPELNFHICNKIGLVPESLKIILEKRHAYKKLTRNTKNQIQKQIYNNRQSILKWILVTSFGYLGFNNAKFGRIDAHIAVCAFARNILLKTMHIAEDMNFDVLHGIVDSIWVKKNENTRQEEYLQLKKVIENDTDFEISFEGVYKWIAFLPSEINTHLPVINRYFGVFEDGKIKTRGIESRRHDTPLFLKRCQNEILYILSIGNSIEDVKKNQIPVVIKKIKIFLSLLKNHKIELKDLVFTKQLSKDYNQYKNRNTLENSAIKQLEINGEKLKAGQIVQYIIKNYYDKSPLKRTIPVQLIDDKTENNKNIYDVRKYSELLINTCNTVLQSFGIIVNKRDQHVYQLDNYY
ncbi:MAG: DNA polymerase domain-containing protein [Nitrososphaeraceae archaeon]